MIDAINDKTLEYSRQGGLAVGGFTWSLHFTWRSVPEREQKRRKSEADPARYLAFCHSRKVLGHMFSASNFVSGCKGFSGKGETSTVYLSQIL